jgi:hypothetical protein
MTVPKYLETFRQAIREAQAREKSEVSEKRGEGEGLNSLNTLISPLRFGRLGRTLSVLEAHCPDHVPVDRWERAIEDGRTFLAKWGEQAQALGWTEADLFGLHTPPATPHPSYRRLSRYDATGLIWFLERREVAALTDTTASIRNPKSGSVTVYRKHNKPAYGPLGDSLDDFR